MDASGEQDDADKNQNNDGDDQTNFDGFRVLFGQFLSGFSPVLLGAVIAVGVGDGSDDENQHCQEHDSDCHALRQERGEHHDHAADNPHRPAEAVGGVPVFLTGQRPAHPDAHGVVLAALGQVVADDQEQKAHSRDQQSGRGEVRPQGQRILDSAAQIGNEGNDPQDHGQRLLVAALVFRIQGGGENADPVARQHDQRQSEHHKG